MKRLSRIIGVASLVLMATAGPALATHGRSDHMVPFQGSVLALEGGQIFPTPEAPLDCPGWAEWQFFNRGMGQMSHLGRAELDLIQCSRYVAFPFFGESVGTTSFTAANGDVLVLAHELEFEVFSTVFPVPDGFEGQGTWTVVDGTGRFANATGSGSMIVIGDVPTDDTPMFDLPPGGTLWTFAGMIAYDASSRSNA